MEIEGDNDSAIAMDRTANNNHQEPTFDQNVPSLPQENYVANRRLAVAKGSTSISQEMSVMHQFHETQNTQTNTPTYHPSMIGGVAGLPTVG